MLALGFGAFLAWGDLVPKQIAEAHLHVLAEVALVILLFLDAARIDIQSLLKRHRWPLRTLIIGMPLAFLGGTAVIWLLFPGWPLAVAALIGAILVPTDAPLGQSVIRNEDVPERHRRAITIETGIQNSGLGLVLIFAFFGGLGGMAVAAAFWGVWHAVSGLALASLWSRREALR